MLVFSYCLFNLAYTKKYNTISLIVKVKKQLKVKRTFHYNNIVLILENYYLVL